jgi:hypothetical protein
MMSAHLEQQSQIIANKVRDKTLNKGRRGKSLNMNILWKAYMKYLLTP